MSSEINLKISTYNEPALQARKQLQERAENTFYISRTSGNQKYFVDVENDKHDLQQSHIIGIVSFWGTTYAEAKSIVKDATFKSIINEEVFRPNAPKVIADGGLYYLNSWRPSEIIPDGAADFTPFFDHLLKTLKSEEKVNYYLDMLAWRYQKPNENKPHIAFYFYGAKGGSGKSTHVETIKKVFGETSIKVINTVKSLDDGSSVQLWKRTWLVIEEANVAKGTQLYDNLKSFTGNDSVDAPEKHKHFSKHRIPAQLIMTSNRAPAFIEPNDRRFFVCEWTMEGKDEEITLYFNEYRAWLESGGYEAIAHHLSTRKLARDVYKPAMMTPEKVQAQMVTSDDCVQDIIDFLDDHKDSRIFLKEDFQEIFESHHVKPSQIKYKLREAGLKKTKRISINRMQEYWWIYKDEEIRSSQGKPAIHVSKEKTETKAEPLVYKVADKVMTKTKYLKNC